jgi:hypothetical protein
MAKQKKPSRTSSTSSKRDLASPLQSEGLSRPQVSHPKVDYANVPTVVRNELPLLWVDTGSIYLRPDDVGTLRLFAFVEQTSGNVSSIEVARLQSSHKFWKGFISMMANALDFYPERPNQPVQANDKGFKVTEY